MWLWCLCHRCALAYTCKEQAPAMKRDSNTPAAKASLISYILHSSTAAGEVSECTPCGCVSAFLLTCYLKRKQMNPINSRRATETAIYAWWCCATPIAQTNDASVPLSSNFLSCLRLWFIKGIWICFNWRKKKKNLAKVDTNMKKTMKLWNEMMLRFPSATLIIHCIYWH